MPFPTTIARFNRRVTNPIARHVAGRIPPLAILEHRGRRSGTTYRTPIMAFRSHAHDRRGDGFVIALTYGPATDWVRNVLAEGGCTLEHGRRRIALADPRLTRGSPGGSPLPAPVRLVLRLIRVSDYLLLRRVDDQSSPASSAEGQEPPRAASTS